MRSFIITVIMAIGFVGAKSVDIWVQVYMNDTPILAHVRPALNWYTLLSQLTGFLFGLGFIFGIGVLEYVFTSCRAKKLHVEKTEIDHDQAHREAIALGVKRLRESARK